MPIYEYECRSCGKFEVIQKFSDPPLKKCETCREPVRKLVSQSSFTLKGGGWYKDLYGSVKKDSGSSSTTESKPKSDSGSKKSDTKTAAA